MRLTTLLCLVPLVQSYVISERHRHTHGAHYVRPGQLVLGEEMVMGVGVHFSMSHATAAVRYQNGRVEDLVKVQGSEEFVGAMGRWADPQAKMDCNTLLEKTQCYGATVKRRWNKWVGRPATKDIGILAALLEEVKAEVEMKLEAKAEIKGHRGPIAVTNILPVFPILPAFNEQDIQDAMEFVGLTWSSSHIYQETNAAYAALGHGLCKSWKCAHACAKEDAAMSSSHILFLNFDSASFSASLQYLSAASHQDGIYASTLSIDHGWDSLPVYEVARAKFWAKIQDMILEVAGKLQRPPKKVVLMGQFGQDAEFVEVVKDVLWEILEVDVVNLMEGDGWLAPARGAAEIAARSEWLNMKRAGIAGEDVVEL